MFKDQVDVPIVVCFHDLVELDHVFMVVESLKKHDLSVGGPGWEEMTPMRKGREEHDSRKHQPECSLCVGGVLEGIKNFLQGHLVFGLLVDGLPHDTVGLRTAVSSYGKRRVLSSVHRGWGEGAHPLAQLGLGLIATQHLLVNLVGVSR